MKAYLSIVRLRFRVQLQYRAAALAGFVTQFFFGIVRVMVFNAFYSSTTVAQPISLAQAVTYSWLVQVTFRLVPWYGDTEMINTVRSGGLSYELCRPLNLYWAWYCRLIALRMVPFLLGGIPTLIVASLLPASFALAAPASWSALAAFSVSMLFAVILGCSVTNIVSISALWTISGEGMQRVLPAFVMFLSGLVIPLPFFPDWAQPVLAVLPFSALADAPFRFYIGSLSPGALPAYLGLQLFWTALFAGLGLALLKSATGRVVLQGG
jgi:ABC-2 type transport system permease protein